LAFFEYQQFTHAVVQQNHPIETSVGFRLESYFAAIEFVKAHFWLGCGSLKFPELFTPTQKIELCEFDLNVGACTEPVLNHGRGVNPFVLFQALFGTRIVTRNLMITQAKKTNGGGISFSAEPTVYIERLKLGNENASKCSQNPGRIELMSNQLEFEIASSICIAATPPIPAGYKISTDVLAYDHTNKDYYVRWKVKHYSFGYYSSSDGVAKLSLR
jgi:hypothetical protein